MPNSLPATNYTSAKVMLGVNLNTANTQIGYLMQQYTSTATAAGTTTLTNSSTYTQFFTGVTTQIIVLPNATTLFTSYMITLVNKSTGLLTIKLNDTSTTLITMIAGSTTSLVCTDIASSNGTWQTSAFPNYTGSNVITATTFDGNVTGSSGSSTGNSATATILATTRAIYGNNFNGSAALTQVINSEFGGTGNGFTKFTGAATAEKIYTLPNAACVILTDNNKTGTGAAVLANTPTLITPVLGVATATSINLGVSTLSRFETGTFTLTDNSGAGLSITTNYANYIRIGNAVIINFSVTYPSTASGSNATVTGLPFSSLNNPPVNCVSNAPTVVGAQLATSGITLTFVSNAFGSITNTTLSGKVVGCSSSYIATT